MKHYTLDDIPLKFPVFSMALEAFCLWLFATQELISVTFSKCSLPRETAGDLFWTPFNGAA